MTDRFLIEAYWKLYLICLRTRACGVIKASLENPGSSHRRRHHLSEVTDLKLFRLSHNC